MVAVDELIRDGADLKITGLADQVSKATLAGILWSAKRFAGQMPDLAILAAEGKAYVDARKGIKGRSAMAESDSKNRNTQLADLGGIVHISQIKSVVRETNTRIGLYLHLVNTLDPLEDHALDIYETLGRELMKQVAIEKHA